MAENKQDKNDEYFMRQAIKEAKKAELIDEVPIGAVLVHEGKIIAQDIICAKRSSLRWLMRKSSLLRKAAGK